MSVLEVLIYGIGFCFLSMSLTWLIAKKLNFYSLVDAVWAYGIGVLALVYSFLSRGSDGKKILALFFSILWSVRLGSYLAVRLKSHFPTEDRRYVELRTKWGKGNFFIFFQIQALSQILFSLPILILMSDKDDIFSFATYFGVVIFLIGFLGESIADRQLNQFRRIPENKNKVCNVGLWRYSRHPNYFFEWLVWCGISISALSSDFGYIGLLSPIAMYLTLNYLTGIPAVEEQSLKSKGDLYRQYQRTTNRFFLGLRR